LHLLVKKRINEDNVESILEATTVLVDLGMDPNVGDEFGRTALYYLLDVPDRNDKDAMFDVVTRLVQLGADPTKPTEM